MKKKSLLWLIGISLVLVIVFVIVGRSRSQDGTKVAIEEAAPHTIKETVSASGKIYPETEVKISPEVSGEIIELTVQEGDSVRQGQLLARINPNIYNSVVTQQEATVQESRARVANSKEMVAQAKAQFDQAQANYNRNKKLYEEKVISALEFEQLESQFRSAQAAYEAARANVASGQFSVEGASATLSQARENLRRTVIVAPTSGIISALNVKLGERVVGTAQMAGTEMLTIANLGRIEVRVDVSETDIAKVKIGDSAKVEADAYRNRKFSGTVSKISVSSKATGAQQVSTDQVTNYTVHILIMKESYADLINQASRSFPFKPGMSASVEIQTNTAANALSVPVNAVTTRDYPDSVKAIRGSDEELRQVVFVYNDATKKVALRDVKTGLQDNQFIQILDGLKAGEKVVTAPYGAVARTLKDDAIVQVTEKDKIFDSGSKKKED